MHSTDDSNAVLDYLVSRDAVAGLEAALPLRKVYAREEADALARFPRPFMSDSFERLYWYYNDRVVVYPDTDTGIITIRAQAFRPDDAQAIARQLLTQAEALVNAMNARLEADTVTSAETAVAEATKVVLAAQEEVTRFRNSEIVVDPSENAVAQLSTITDLSGEVDEVLAQIAQSKRVSPANPAVSALKAKADAIAAQIAAEEKALAGSREAVADKVSAYERLMLLRTLADTSLQAATMSLDSAREDARRQHVFVEEIVAPNLPDEPTEPQRLRAVGQCSPYRWRRSQSSGWSRSASRSIASEREPRDGDPHDGYERRLGAEGRCRCDGSRPGRCGSRTQAADNSRPAAAVADRRRSPSQRLGFGDAIGCSSAWSCCRC